MTSLLRSSGSATTPPGAQDQVHNRVHALAVLDLRENGWPTLSHLPGIAIHDPQVCSHDLRQIRLVDNQQVALRDARTALPRDLVSSAHVDHVDDKVRQFARVVGREVVAA